MSFSEFLIEKQYDFEGEKRHHHLETDSLGKITLWKITDQDKVFFKWEKPFYPIDFFSLSLPELDFLTAITMEWMISRLIFPPNEEDRDAPFLCHCSKISYQSVREQAWQFHFSLNDIKKALNVGNSCGGCHKDLLLLLEESRQEKPIKQQVQECLLRWSEEKALAERVRLRAQRGNVIYLEFLAEDQITSLKDYLFLKTKTEFQIIL